MRVMRYELAIFSSQNLLQLWYPRIVKVDVGDFTLLQNNKEQGGSGFLMFSTMFPSEKHQDPLSP